MREFGIKYGLVGGGVLGDELEEFNQWVLEQLASIPCDVCWGGVGGCISGYATGTKMVVTNINW